MMMMGDEERKEGMNGYIFGEGKCF